jgi:hypothetical protein
MKIFDEQFKGKTARGSGTIQKVEKFNYDFVLGNKPGCKVTVKREKTEIVVALAESEYEGLQEAKGTEFAFHGTLVRMDTFPARFYVTDGVRS